MTTMLKAIRLGDGRLVTLGSYTRIVKGAREARAQRADTRFPDPCGWRTETVDAIQFISRWMEVVHKRINQHAQAHGRGNKAFRRIRRMLKRCPRHHIVDENFEDGYYEDNPTWRRLMKVSDGLREVRRDACIRDRKPYYALENTTTGGPHSTHSRSR